MNVAQVPAVFVLLVTVERIALRSQLSRGLQFGGSRPRNRPSPKRLDLTFAKRLIVVTRPDLKNVALVAARTGSNRIGRVGRDVGGNATLSLYDRRGSTKGNYA